MQLHGRLRVEVQQQLAELAGLPDRQRLAFIRSLSTAEALELIHTWRLWARPEQLAPDTNFRTADGTWDNWLILAGRGFGKTRSGAEWVHEQVEAGVKRIALVARTAADIRDVMVEGESGILATAHPARRPKWNPSKRRLTWPNGAIATTFSSQEPNSLRGPQYEKAWCDELAAWTYAQETWIQLQMVLRLGKHPQACITTTPRPTALIRALVADPRTVVTRGSTYDNQANLPRPFLERLERQLEGSRLGRQELHAEILDDNPGALWKQSWIDDRRIATAPELRRIVVAVDPAATSEARSCECGIIVAGVGTDGHGYVLADRSTDGSPMTWGQAAVAAYREFKADRIVAETNLGGRLVEMLLRTVDRNVPFRDVRAARGKHIRAEPVAALYEKGRVHHVGTFAQLEDQLCTWDPSMVQAPANGARREESLAAASIIGSAARISSDRLDALVWALTDLMVEGIPDAGVGRMQAFSAGFAPTGENPFEPTEQIKW